MPIIKTIDVVGVSEESWGDAARQALAEAAKTIRHIEGMDILSTSAVVESGASAIVSPVAGFRTASPSAPATLLPSMKFSIVVIIVVPF